MIAKLSTTELFSEQLKFLDAGKSQGSPGPRRSDLQHPTLPLLARRGGGVVLGPVGQLPAHRVGSTIADNAWIDFVDADRAIPEFRWGRLVAVTFWSELTGGDGQEVWRHLERHEPGYIVHAVYKGTATSLGRI
ncbi:hypothetical protein GS481_02445 [Rhodococcus hoagii]|nr:hypothetical protein [Prescottella equi]